MKKKIAVILAMTLVLCCSCNAKDTSIKIETTISTQAETSAKETVSVPETKETEEPSSIPGEKPHIDHGESENYTYHEGRNYFLYVEKGGKVDTGVYPILEQVMKEEEELFGLSYDMQGYEGPIGNFKSFFMGKELEGVNQDHSKMEILISVEQPDGTVEWSSSNELELFDGDLLDKSTLNVAYHEFAHLLRQRQSPQLGRVLEEGIALYAERVLSEKAHVPDWSYIQYVDTSMVFFDEDEMLRDPETAFIKTESEEHDGRQNEYQYGVRFMTFLIETYGIGIVKDLGEAAKLVENPYEDCEALVWIIKRCTSPEVFSDFAKWYKENWQKHCDAYYEYMKPFDTEGFITAG